MKLLIKATIIVFFSLLIIAFPGQVWAQAGSPGNSTPTVGPTAGPAATADVPKGIITGKIVNKNDSTKPVGELEVMLHVVDQNQDELGMLHGKSVKDGSFKIADVPFQAGIGYVAAVVYEGTTYYSSLVSAEAGKISLNINVPVYESTTDLAKVQVEQMHVLFSFASDGMDVKELYAISNLGDRTVKDGADVPGENGAKAAVSFPLPEKADFINFQPQDETRFVKFPGGFVDTAAIIPGQMVSQFVVGYLMPYNTPLTFQLKTVLPVTRLNLVVPKESGVMLQGAGLEEPERVTGQDGQLFYLYKLENISAGKTLDFTFEGKLVIPKGQTTITAASSAALPNQLPLFLGLGVFGAVLVGGGAFWWVRSAQNGETHDAETDEAQRFDVDQEFEGILTEIAQLDQRFEQGELDEGTYREQRALLLAQAAQAAPAKDIQAEAAEYAADDLEQFQK